MYYNGNKETLFMLIVVFLDIEVNVPKGEAGHRITRLEVFHKKGFLLKLKNSVSLFLGDFIKQCTLAQLFSCEFYEIFKSMNFLEQFRTAVSEAIFLYFNLRLTYYLNYLN